MKNQKIKSIALTTALFASVGGVAAMTPAFAASLAPAQETTQTFMLDTPYRAYDTREDEQGGKIMAGEKWSFDVLSDKAGVAKIPADAKGVIYNLTYANPEGGGWLAVTAADTQASGTSSINYADGAQPDANASLTTIPTSGDMAGQVAVTAGGNGGAHFVFDVVGYVK